MRKFLTLVLVVLAGPLRAEEAAFQYASYEILADYPDCSGPGYIAYKTSFDVTLEDAIYLVGQIEPVCSITVNRGGKTERIDLPCVGAAEEAVTTEEFFRSDAFCPATQELRPAEVRIQGELIGCISINGHAFVGGKWKATTERPDRSTVVSGTYDDPRLATDYFASPDGEASFFAPSLSIWLELEDESVSSMPDATVRTVGHVDFLPLIDLTRPDCRADPKGCWREGKSLELTWQVDQFARICRYTDEDPGSRAYITRKIPDEREH